MEKAADNFLSSSLSIGNLSKENFPLPILEKRLTKLKDTLINGIGLEVIRELPDCFKERYGSIKVGNRGGIMTANTKLTFEIS